MKKMKVLLGLLSLLSIPLVSADIGSTLSNVFNKILSIGTLQFLGVSGVLPLTRILIGIFIFTIIFATITALGGDSDSTRPFSFFNRAQAGIIAAIIAVITAIFLPPQILLAAGTGWATIVALLLIGGPVVGLAFLLWEFPGEDKDGNSKETKSTVLLKLVLCMLLFWILSAMKNAAVLG